MTKKKSIRLEFDEKVKKELSKKAKKNNRSLKNHLETIIEETIHNQTNHISKQK